MRDNVLDRYAPRVVETAKRQADEPGALDDLGAFGILRGVQDRSLMLELRLANGNSVAFNYSYLAQASFDPSQGITLFFGGKKVTISGSNLNTELRHNLRLYEAILRHRVPWVREADRHDLRAAPPGSVVIDGIDIEG